MHESRMLSTRSEVSSERGVVSAGHLAEAQAGARLLAEGGNAVDAVVAAAFVGFVVEPASCGVGGYGHFSAYLADTGTHATVDHSPRIPAAATPTMFEPEISGEPLYYGWPRVVGRRNEQGHLAVAVPGAVAGLCAAQQRWGAVTLAQVLEPAIEQAERGVDVTWELVLAINERLPEIRAIPEAAEMLLRGGDPPKPMGWLGARDRLDTSPLARTLRAIASRGAAGFYEGEIAEAIVDEVRRGGGILTTADLASYEPRLLVEHPRQFAGSAYVTGFDHLGYEILNILEHHKIGSIDPHDVTFHHVVAEAMALAFADVMEHWGDPDHTDAPLSGLASEAYAAVRAGEISTDRALKRPVQAGDPRPFGDDMPPRLLPYQGTSQMTAADGAGNVAALITSLTHAFGSAVLVPGTGIFLNNSMVNYDPRPGRANSIAPGKMPIFAAPLLVSTREDGLALGVAGSGGYRIAAGVLHTALHALLHGMTVQQAIDAPRVHCQGNETFVDERIPVEAREALAALGHNIIAVSDTPGVLNFGRVSAVKRSPDGILTGGSGPAWWSAAAAV